ncbi:MAG: thrombospondin type 3 repeat-containing protein [Phycisphaerae bacterium]|nr:thrombospondin type 3 repeat-containing protein [Phycisphaerae bacterium]
MTAPGLRLRWTMGLGAVCLLLSGVGGCCTPSDDTDGDGIPDAQDNCPFVSNPDQGDMDGDGLGNPCDDSPNLPDADPNDANTADPNVPGATAERILVDHTATAGLSSIPSALIDAVKSGFRVFYGHTSHGGQLMTGAEMLYAEDARLAVNQGTGSLSVEEIDADLGEYGDTSWADTTRDVLDEAGNTINVVMWSWCGGVSNNTEEDIDAYLGAMSQLEVEYPNVVFVYMTGHLDGTGPSDTLYVNNNQIRDYCRNNDKVLYDFADIESYDPAGNYYAWESDGCAWCATWCASHTCPSCIECAHSHCFNCYQKGKAFWWMMARLAGWDGS